MKTQYKILLDAEVLERHAVQVLVQESNLPDLSPSPDARVLLKFPETLIRSYQPSETGAEAIHTHRKLRWIVVGYVGDSREFNLIEEEFESTASGRVVRHVEPAVLARSGCAEEVLTEGHRRVEEDRLAESLALVLSRVEEGIFGRSTRKTVAEVERITEVQRLSAAARLKARADILELLDGRLKLGEFITRTIGRQYRAEEVISERARFVQAFSSND